jgi:uncharacterized protein
MFLVDESSQIVEQQQPWLAQRASTPSDIAPTEAAFWLVETASISAYTP